MLTSLNAHNPCMFKSRIYPFSYVTSGMFNIYTLLHLTAKPTIISFAFRLALPRFQLLNTAVEEAAGLFAHYLLFLFSVILSV